MAMKQRWYTLEYSCLGLRVACIAGTLWLAGCASNPSAPVEDRSFGANAADTAATAGGPAAPTSATGASYRVLRGDTLYAIAFKHGVDYRDLAAWNRIVPPYRIYADQQLRLSAPQTSTSAVTGVPIRAVTSVAPEHSSASTGSLPAPTQNPHVENAAPPPTSAPTAGFQPAEIATPPAI